MLPWLLLGLVTGAAAGQDRLMADLSSAAALFERGLLSAEEFALTKARLLAPAPPPAPLKTFGTGQSAFIIPSDGSERTIFEHAVGPGSTGVMTHFWCAQRPTTPPPRVSGSITPHGRRRITGLEWKAHPPQHGVQVLSNGTDNVTVRYFVDGEANASVAFKPPMASGVGFSDNASGWGNAKIGRAGMGGWYVNLKIPFGRTIKVTVALDGVRQVPSPGHNPAFIIVRGCENLPVQVGTQTLPAAARLRLHKIESRVFQPLEFVPLLDLPTGRGLVYLVTLAAHSTDYGFWEGCVHMRTPHDQPFPGTLLSTGTEDYFDSAFGFDSGRFYTPQSGCTHR